MPEDNYKNNTFSSSGIKGSFKNLSWRKMKDNNLFEMWIIVLDSAVHSVAPGCTQKQMTEVVV